MASAKAKDILKSNEDIVHALWRHRGKREQGSRTGRCGWITSFLILLRPSISKIMVGLRRNRIPSKRKRENICAKKKLGYLIKFFRPAPLWKLGTKLWAGRFFFLRKRVGPIAQPAYALGIIKTSSYDALRRVLRSPSKLLQVNSKGVGGLVR